MNKKKRELTLTVETLEKLLTPKRNKRIKLIKELIADAGNNGYANHETFRTAFSIKQDEHLLSEFRNSAKSVLSKQQYEGPIESHPLYREAIYAVANASWKYYRDIHTQYALDANSRNLLKNVYCYVNWDEVGEEIVNSLEENKRSTDSDGN